MDNITADSWISNPEENLQFIENHRETIPELGFTPVNLLKDGQLVRFRGMIQDMADPVIYLSQYEVLNETTGVKQLRSGKYRDVYLPIKEDEVIIDNSENCKNGDRRSYYCVSIPGLNKWTLLEKMKKGCPKTSDVPSSSSMIFDEDKKGERMADEEASSTKGAKSLLKRSFDQMMEIEETSVQNIDRSKSSSESGLRDGRTSKEDEEMVTNEEVVKENVDINIGDDKLSCVINLYDEEDSCIKLNDVVDVIGFISFNSGFDDLDDNELSPSLVPRIHVVHFKQIIGSNPYLMTMTPCHQVQNDDILNRACQIRSDLMLALTQLMLGDSMAAQYLLCNLISRIYKRQDVISLGKFCLNLSNVPTDCNYPEEFYNIIERLVAKSCYLPLSLDFINSEQFVPVKDYDRNRLKSGVLQLSNNTHLILDETKLQTGKLIDKGLSNVKSLENLITYQKLKCDFKFNEIEYPVDLPIIVISQGKSILSNDVRVVLNAESSCSYSIEETFRAVNEYLKEPLLGDVRHYLNCVADQEFDLSEELIGTIQEDYVKLRQNDKTISEFDLHTLLDLARLLSLSYGKRVLSKEIWDMAYSMEIERKSRIREAVVQQSN